MGRYLLIIPPMRRKSGVLLPLEVQILDAGLALQVTGQPSFHGFALAKQLADARGAKRLTAHGALYRALVRMERAGLLESWWEDAEHAAAGGRPRRRLYRVTLAGAQALAARGEAVDSRMVHRLAGTVSG